MGFVLNEHDVRVKDYFPAWCGHGVREGTRLDGGGIAWAALVDCGSPDSPDLVIASA